VRERENERERVSARVREYVLERKKESGRERGYEREREYVHVLKDTSRERERRKSERECCVRERGREHTYKKTRKIICARETVCGCVYASRERGRECMCLRERQTTPVSQKFFVLTRA